MKPLAELSPEEKRALAARACGFNFVQWSCRKLKGVAITSNGYLVDVPDYGNDLNAMHEAEKTLTPSIATSVAAAIPTKLLLFIRRG